MFYFSIIFYTYNLQKNLLASDISNILLLSLLTSFAALMESLYEYYPIFVDPFYYASNNGTMDNYSAYFVMKNDQSWIWTGIIVFRPYAILFSIVSRKHSKLLGTRRNYFRFASLAYAWSWNAWDFVQKL